MLQSQEKIHVALLCGGQSAEHEVSIRSAKNVLQALDPQKYTLSIIVITLEGEWILLQSSDVLLNNPDMHMLPQPLPGSPLLIRFGSAQPFINMHNNLPLKVDVVFPILHGTHGEDGTLQGLMELMNLPYVSAGTLGSAVTMDKEVSKKLLQAAGVPVSKWLVATKESRGHFTFEQVVEELGLPLFIKPANTGSSVGVSKVRNAAEFSKAMDLAFHYDNKILFEEFISGREIECSVLGNDKIETSLPGEIICQHDFYSYEAKYLDPLGADLKIPADLSEKVRDQIRAMAEKAFAALYCEGMARVDFFLADDGRIIVNEVNTIPGFTQISMYPKMWAASGLAYPLLIARLIELAFERFKRNRLLIDQRSVAERKGL